MTKGEVKNAVPDAEDTSSAAMQYDNAWLSSEGFLPFRLAVPREIKREEDTRNGSLVTVDGRIVRIALPKNQHLILLALHFLINETRA